MDHALSFYIDGAWVDPVDLKRLPVIDPSTEEAYAEIAVGGFGRMYEESRRPRRCEGRCYLLADMPGFTDARDDNAAACFSKPCDRFLEGLTEAISELCSQRSEALLLYLQSAHRCCTRGFRFRTHRDDLQLGHVTGPYWRRGVHVSVPPLSVRLTSDVPSLRIVSVELHTIADRGRKRALEPRHMIVNGCNSRLVCWREQLDVLLLKFGSRERRPTLLRWAGQRGCQAACTS